MDFPLAVQAPQERTLQNTVFYQSTLGVSSSKASPGKLQNTIFGCWASRKACYLNLQNLVDLFSFK